MLKYIENILQRIFEQYFWLKYPSLITIRTCLNKLSCILPPHLKTIPLFFFTRWWTRCINEWHLACGASSWWSVVSSVHLLLCGFSSPPSLQQIVLLTTLFPVRRPYITSSPPPREGENGSHHGAVTETKRWTVSAVIPGITDLLQTSTDMHVMLKYAYMFQLQFKFLP